jgi:predicted transcriptional regulator
MTVQPLRAHVHNGRLLLDEPTDLPEGAEVNLAIVDEDEMGEEERARLDAALERSMAQAKAGKLIDGDEVIGRLLAQG